MTSTGHYRRLYNQDRSLPTTLCTFYTIIYSPQNTLKIQGRVLWHLPVTTDGFIIKTGHCRRLYTRFTQLGKVPQNTLKIHGRVLWHLPVTTDYFINVPHKYWGSGRPASVSDTSDSGRALPTVRIIVPSSLMVSVWPNTAAQTISERYLVVGHSLIERVTIFLYLTVQEHNWILHVIHFKSTQIRPDFYIYTHERSFCLIVSIIINFRYISRCVLQISSQSGLCYMRFC